MSFIIISYFLLFPLLPTFFLRLSVSESDANMTVIRYTYHHASSHLLQHETKSWLVDRKNERSKFHSIKYARRHATKRTWRNHARFPARNFPCSSHYRYLGSRNWCKHSIPQNLSRATVSLHLSSITNFPLLPFSNSFYPPNLFCCYVAALSAFYAMPWFGCYLRFVRLLIPGPTSLLGNQLRSSRQSGELHPPYRSIRSFRT